MKWYEILAVLLISIALGCALIYGLDQGEKSQCFGWSQDAHELTGFYLTRDQAVQCAHYGIVVDAPIK